MTTPAAQALIERLNRYAEIAEDEPAYSDMGTFIPNVIQGEFYDDMKEAALALTQAGGDAVAEKVDIETRNGRRFYFNHNPPNTMLAIIFNDILRANGTFEDNIEAHYRREHAARPAPVQENDNGTV